MHEVVLAGVHVLFAIRVQLSEEVFLQGEVGAGEIDVSLFQLGFDGGFLLLL